MSQLFRNHVHDSSVVVITDNISQLITTKKCHHVGTGAPKNQIYGKHNDQQLLEDLIGPSNRAVSISNHNFGPFGTISLRSMARSGSPNTSDCLCTVLKIG